MTDFEPDRWRLSGPLTAREVPVAFARSAAQRDRHGMPAEVDLGSVAETDSSALALLLEWLSWARKSGSGTAFRDPPDSLRVLAELTDTEEILGWSGEGAGA